MSRFRALCIASIRTRSSAAEAFTQTADKRCVAISGLCLSAFSNVSVLVRSSVLLASAHASVAIGSMRWEQKHKYPNI